MKKDIQKMLTDIRSVTGWSEPRIAREIGTSQPTVHRILKGQLECKISTFMAIEQLSARTKRKSTQPAQ